MKLIQKLKELGLINLPELLALLEKIEPVGVSLTHEGYPLYMAVYRACEGVGILFWVNNAPLGRSRDADGDLIFIDENRKPVLRFASVGHLYGWPSGSYEEVWERVGVSEEEKNRLFDEERAKHYQPVALATAAACKKLGVSKLVKWDGYFAHQEIPDVTIDDNWEEDVRNLMTHWGDYKDGCGTKRPIRHFVFSLPTEAG